MCGIAGTFATDGSPASATVLSRMAELIAHRGPDGEGIFTDGPLGLAHRRLSIIDLSAAGHQPMQTRDGRFTLSYNGEIFNFQELRLELEALGHPFRSRTDTEVLLEGFAEWGLAVLDRLNGMFAFAVWDAKESRLVLARDRYGIKPLYYTQCGQTLLFASETKAFLAHPAYSVGVDRAALFEYFAFQNLFSDRSLFDGVRLLPAGCWMEVPLKGSPKIHRYWDLDFREEETGGSEQDYVEEFNRLFQQAVQRQLVSDVDVGCYLSGGLDSGSITAIASKQLPNLRTFTVGFDLHSASGLEMAFDERDRAELMSYLFGTEHYEMVLKAGDMERVMPRLAWYMEEPRVGQSYPNFYAAQLASKFGKVVLAGTGGDELFGGYPWRYYRAVVNDDFDHYVDKYFSYWQRLVPADMARKLFAPIASSVDSVHARDIFKAVFAGTPQGKMRAEDYINCSLYLEAKTFLHGLLVVEDKLSMAHGLETRVPFLDNDLVDFALKLPIRFKLANLGEVVSQNENEPGRKKDSYFKKTKDGKLLLRKAMQKYFPPKINEAAKQGFSAPDGSWFKGESIEYVRDRLMGRDAALFEFLDRKVIHGLVEDHLEGRENRRLLIWSLLSVEEWLSTFLGSQAGSAAHPMPIQHMRV